MVAHSFRGCALGLIRLHHMKQFACLSDRLNAIRDGEGTLLDHSLLVCGAAISDGNTHFHDGLPIALIEVTVSGMKGCRHIRCAQQTPLANFWLTVLDRMAVLIDKLGDNTATVDHLTSLWPSHAS